MLSKSHNIGISKPVAYCSRTLAPAEQRYAQIEKECLAGVWACERFAQYVTGLPSFKLFTDHKPFIPLLTTKTIDTAPLRCQCLLIRMMRFNPEPVYVSGKQLVIADALSRKSQGVPRADDIELEEEVTAHVDAVRTHWPASSEKQSALMKATDDNPTLRKIISYIMDGWPRHSSTVGEDAAPYHSMKAELSVSNGLVIYRDRIVIPPAIRTDILERLHESHQGLTKCQARAQSCVWWPGITRDFTELVNNCMECREKRPTQRSEPLMPSELPERPWQSLAADLFELKNKHYLVVIDYYSRWIEIKPLYTNCTAPSVTAKMKAIFAVHGIPDIIRSDNGPQFTSNEYIQFAASYGFEIVTSSPHFTQSNGMAERAVQTSKNILQQQDVDIALLNYRNTPHSSTGKRPAEALMGRKIRGRVPVLTKLRNPKDHNRDEIASADRKAKAQHKVAYDQHHGTKQLPEIKPGQSVLLKNDNENSWDRTGIVMASDPQIRSHLVLTPEGVFRRNRKHIQKVPSVPLPLPASALEPEQ